ncbi:MAG: DoxX family protein [Acidobacteria bacterium]|nr:DoxX family protein [Acidobacteriota bacterium]
MSASRTSLLRPSTTYYDCGLLILRLWYGLLLLFGHGLGKMTNFSRMSAHFPDPLHIGSSASLLLALLAEVVGSLLLIFGLLTRVACALIIIELAVAFALVHHFKLFGQGGGELALLYIGAAVVLAFTGPGRYSVDAYRR